MLPQVFDAQGVERTWQWARGKYGNLIYNYADEQKKFALKYIYETKGPALVNVLVLNDAGGPQFDQPVVEHWPNNQETDITGSGFRTLPYARALVARTDMMGQIDLPFGRDAMIKDLAVGGPFTLWIGSMVLPSDAIENVGWLGGTDHYGMLRFVFQITDVEEPEPPEPPVVKGCPNWNGVTCTAPVGQVQCPMPAMLEAALRAAADTMTPRG